MSLISSGSSRAMRSVGSSRISSSDARSINRTSQALASSSRDRSRRARGPRMGVIWRHRSYPANGGLGPDLGEDCVRDRPDLDRRGPPDGCWRRSPGSGTRTLPLELALGRVLAEEVTSAIDVPPFDSSGMDGYALIAGPEAELEVIGEARAGHPAREALHTGSDDADLHRCGDAGGRGCGGAGGATASRTGHRARARAGGRAGRQHPPGGRGHPRRARWCCAPAPCSARPSSAWRPRWAARRSAARAARAWPSSSTGDELTPPGEPLEPGRHLQLEQLRARRPGGAGGRGAGRRAGRVPDTPEGTREALARRARRPPTW